MQVFAQFANTTRSFLRKKIRQNFGFLRFGLGRFSVINSKELIGDQADITPTRIGSCV